VTALVTLENLAALPREIKPRLPIDLNGWSGNSFVILATGKQALKDWYKAVHGAYSSEGGPGVWQEIYTEAIGAGSQEELIEILGKYFLILKRPTEEWVPADGLNTDGSFTIELG